MCLKISFVWILNFLRCVEIYKVCVVCIVVYVFFGLYYVNFLDLYKSLNICGFYLQVLEFVYFVCILEDINNFVYVLMLRLVLNLVVLFVMNFLIEIFWFFVYEFVSIFMLFCIYGQVFFFFVCIILCLVWNILELNLVFFI